MLEMDKGVDVYAQTNCPGRGTTFVGSVNLQDGTALPGLQVPMQGNHAARHRSDGGDPAVELAYTSR